MQKASSREGKDPENRESRKNEEKLGTPKNLQTDAGGRRSEMEEITRKERT